MSKRSFKKRPMNFHFGDLHGIVLEPKVCLSKVDVRGGLMRLKWSYKIKRGSPE